MSTKRTLLVSIGVSLALGALAGGGVVSVAQECPPPTVKIVPVATTLECPAVEVEPCVCECNWEPLAVPVHRCPEPPVVIEVEPARWLVPLEIRDDGEAARVGLMLDRPGVRWLNPSISVTYDDSRPDPVHRFYSSPSAPGWSVWGGVAVVM